VLSPLLSYEAADATVNSRMRHNGMEVPIDKQRLSMLNASFMRNAAQSHSPDDRLCLLRSLHGEAEGQ